MASLKAIRKRIISVKNTQKITKAMKMVSAAKLRRAQDAAISARSYADKLTELLGNVAARVGEGAHPLLQARPQVQAVHLILVTADRGLCGGYNTNLIRMAESFLKEHGRDRVRVTFVGRRGFDYFKKRDVQVADKHINIFGGPDRQLAQTIGTQVAAELIDGSTDAVYLIYSQFRSALTQVPTVERLLPVPTPQDEGEAASEYLFEPEPTVLLDRIVRKYISVVMHRAFLESIASEHGARMTAMDSATNNAAEMIDRLTLEMNRARQATITKELMEIVGGAEALKG